MSTRTQKILTAVPLALCAVFAGCTDNSERPWTPEEKMRNLPAALILGKEPVDPVCLSKLFDIDQIKPGLVIDIKNCTDKDMIIDSGMMISGAGVEISYRFKGDPQTPPLNASYTYLGEVESGSAITIERSGAGGNGRMSRLWIVKRDGDQLRLVSAPVPDGDRCNGSIGEASVEDGQLNYTYSITERDWAKLGSNGALTAVQISKINDTPAFSCYGYAKMVNGNLVGIELTELSTDYEPEKKPETYEDCFKEAYYHLTKDGTTALTVPGLQNFMAGVNKICAKLIPNI